MLGAAAHTGAVVPVRATVTLVGAVSDRAASIGVAVPTNTAVGHRFHFIPNVAQHAEIARGGLIAARLAMITGAAAKAHGATKLPVTDLAASCAITIRRASPATLIGLLVAHHTMWLRMQRRGAHRCRCRAVGVASARHAGTGMAARARRIEAIAIVDAAARRHARVLRPVVGQLGEASLAAEPGCRR